MKKIGLSENQRFTLVSLALGLITLFLYWPLWNHDFINADDKVYIRENLHVTTGLTLANVKWAFFSTEQANWHPLTWISHMADCQLFGLQPGAQHMMNVFFHIMNTLLLLLLLKDATGAFWRSVMVAALFAWHPMHVESVAWAAERKDVLSTFFWILSLLAYVQYARNRSILFYLLSLVCFIGGLMSKPMVVTLPFVLLLLDGWSLNRLTRQNIVQIVVEKVPFFILTIASCFITYLAQSGGGAVWNLPWMEKIAMVSEAYLNYVSKIFCPLNLAFPYSHPTEGLTWWSYLAVVFLGLWTGLAFLKAKPKPYFLFGWLFFLGTLVPAIGVVKVGSQSMADRYIYIPSIGLFIIAVWGIYDLLQFQPNQRFILAASGAAALAVCLVLCKSQIGYWRNSRTLFFHAIVVTRDNFLAEDWLGQALRDSGYKKEALEFFSESVKIEPRYPVSQNDLGVQLLEAGRDDEARVHLKADVDMDPSDSNAQHNFGVFLVNHGHAGEGIVYFEQALKLEPNSVNIMNQLAWIYATDAKVGNGRRAVELATRACESTQYDNPAYLRTLAVAYAEAGDFSNAGLWLEKTRIMAAARQQTALLNEMPRYENAFNSKQPYRDPTLN